MRYRACSYGNPVASHSRHYGTKTYHGSKFSPDWIAAESVSKKALEGFSEMNFRNRALILVKG